MTSTVQVNGQDITEKLNAYWESEIPAYKAYRISSVVLTVALAVGYILAGVGLLQVTAWGRLLALSCAGTAILFEIFETIYQFIWVNPAMNKLFATGPAHLRGFATTMSTFGVVTSAVLSIVYNAVLIALLMGEKAARAVRGEYQPEPEYDEDRPRRRRPVRYEDEEEEEDRPRRRPRREEDEDEPPPRRARRPEDIQDEPPRRKPPRPRPRDEDDE